MRYAIRKRRPDRRTRTCGFNIANGEVLIVDLSFDNLEAIKNILLYGYLVHQTNATEGTYYEDAYDMLGMEGKQITPITLGLAAPPRPELDYLNEIEGL